VKFLCPTNEKQSIQGYIVAFLIDNRHGVDGLCIHGQHSENSGDDFCFSLSHDYSSLPV
jgi:hypothetical protein